MKQEKSCGCIIVNDQQVLLIAARDKDGRMFWSFPKGHQEDGESDLETAIRETKEETNLDVDIIDDQPIKTGHFIEARKSWKDIFLFIAKPKDIEYTLIGQAGEVEIMQWVKFDEVSKLLSNYYTEVWAEVKTRLNI